MSDAPPSALAVDAEGLRIGLVAARFNQALVDDLLSHALATLDAAGVRAEDIETIRVPGSAEVPYAVTMLAKTGEFDALIALGVIIAGATRHHEHIVEAANPVLQRIAVETEVPVINGLILTENAGQAEERCRGPLNRGRDFAQAAVEMADLKRRLVQRLDELDLRHAEQEAAQWAAQLEAEDDDPDDLSDGDTNAPWKS